jgi:hypothetical protein
VGHIIITEVTIAHIVIRTNLTTVEDTRTATSTIVVEIDIVVDTVTEIIITTKEAIIIEEIDSTIEAIITVVVISISVIIAYRYLPTTHIITIIITTRI